MNTWLNKSIYARLTFLNLVMLAVVVGMIFGLWRLDVSSSQQLLSTQLSEEKTNFQHISDADGQSLENLARDYSFWDDMVSFVTTHDQDFAKNNIDTGLMTYKVDTAAVYDLKKKMVYTARADQAVDMVLTPDFFDKLSHDRFAHFFQKNGDDLLEIRAATIHPSNDEAHTTAPKGYWIVGRLWNKQYLQHINDLTQSTLAVHEKATDENKVTNTDIVFSVPANDWRGNAVASITVTHPQVLSARLQTSVWHDVILIGVMAVLLLAALYLFHQRYVVQPIEIIADSLRNNDPKLVSELAEQPDEFGNLAKAVLELDKQKNALKDAQEKNRQLKKQTADYDDIKKELSDNRNRVAKILEGVLKRSDKDDK